MKTPESVRSDQWLSKPRASNDMELVGGRFKAFGWMVIQSKKKDPSETPLDQDGDVDN